MIDGNLNAVKRAFADLTAPGGHPVRRLVNLEARLR